LREITLPVNEASPSDKHPVRYTINGELLYLVRPFRVDVLSVLDWSITHLPSILIGQPTQVLMVGSKLVIVHDLDGAQQLLIYEHSTRDVQSIELRNTVSLSLEAHDNFIYTDNLSRFQLMPLTTLVNAPRDHTLFLGQYAFLFSRAIAAVGDIRYAWYHNSVPMNNTNPSMVIRNVTEDRQGNYTVEVSDQCNHRVTATARLRIHGKPTFETPLQPSTILCHEPTVISINVTGLRVSYTWTLNGIEHDNPETAVTIHDDKIACGSEDTLCVTATNPSGSSSSCARVRVASLDSIVAGPTPVNDQPNWFTGSEAQLHVRVFDTHCTSHEWFIEGTSLSRFYAQESAIAVRVDSDIEYSAIFVRIYCGSGVIDSRTFRFAPVSVLSVTELAVIIVASAVVFIAALAIVIVVVVAKKKHRYKKFKPKVELDIWNS